MQARDNRALYIRRARSCSAAAAAAAAADSVCDELGLRIQQFWPVNALQTAESLIIS